MQDTLQAARALLADSPRVAAFSGAGLSADSGLPTFRDPDPDSLWSRFDPTELASLAGFAADPGRVIEWYRWRRRKHAAVTPNPAHRALAAQPRLTQVTQNVDHLLEQAGVAPERVLHLHGSLLHDRCHDSSCGYVEAIDPADPPGPRDCPRCGAPLRPAVVWFGEALPAETWRAAEALCRRLDCLLVIGTSAQVYPAAGLIDVARAAGSRVIVVDPGDADAHGAVDLHLRGRAGDLVPALLAGLALDSGG